MPEILPSTADGYDFSFSEVEVPGEGIVQTRTETGPAYIISARRVYWRSVADTLSAGVSSLAYNESLGRASLTISFDREDSDTRNLGVQELYAADIIKDIKSAPYFSSLTNKEVSDVQAAWDNREGPSTSWTALQEKLYGHMAHGQESYVETVYEFRQTFQTSSTSRLQAASADPNTVQQLPTLNNTMANLINGLPSGEWLKKPVSVMYAGRKGWTVTVVYQWAKKWSAIYGGTFTGEDA